MVSHHRLRRVPVLCVQLPGEPVVHADAGEKRPLHGGEHPHLHERLFRLRLCCARLPHPLRQHLPHEAAQAGAGHLFPAGPPHGPGLPPPLSGDPAHRPGRPGHRHPPGHPPLPRPGSAHHRHVLRLSLRGGVRPGFVGKGRGEDRPLLRCHLPAGHGLYRSVRLPGQAHRPHAERAQKRGDAGAPPVAERAHLSGRRRAAARRLCHAAPPGTALYRPALFPHAGPGHPGDPAVFPLALGLSPPGGEEPEKALLQRLNSDK